jgi:hypothetical protein
MSALYDLRVSIDRKIEADHLDATAIRGQIGLRTGRLLSLISPNTPDDPVIVAKLRQAAKEVLHVSL